MILNLVEATNAHHFKFVASLTLVGGSCSKWKTRFVADR